MMAHPNVAMRNPFSTCLNGHPLEGPDAFIVQANGSRACRACILESGAKRRARDVGGSYR